MLGRFVRIRTLMLAGLLVLAAACGEQSRVDPEATVHVGGTVRDVDGSPLADRPVSLGSGVTNLEGGAGVLTVGMFCLSGACTGESFDTSTDAEGRYAFELTGQQTRSSFGEAATFLLSASGPPSGDFVLGPAVAARFRIQATELTLPQLQLVDPDPVLSAADGDVQLAWDAAAAPGPFTVGFVTPDDVPVWQTSAAEGGMRMDGRVLEDLTGLVAVAGTLADRIDGSDVRIQWRSPSLGFRGGFGAPPSRGAPCAVVAADGTTERLETCAVTDGRLGSAALPPVACAPDADRAACPDAERVRLLLREPVPADLVVVRGCAATCRIWTTGAGAAPVERSAISSAHAAVVLDGAPIVAVDVAPSEWVSDLREISVWGPATPDARPLAPAEDVDIADVGSGGAEDGGRGPWVYVAIGAAAVALLAAGVLLGRRSAG